MRKVLRDKIKRGGFAVEVRDSGYRYAGVISRLNIEDTGVGIPPHARGYYVGTMVECERSSVVEHQLPKLDMGVRFPSLAK